MSDFNHKETKENFDSFKVIFESQKRLIGTLLAKVPKDNPIKNDLIKMQARIQEASKNQDINALTDILKETGYLMQKAS